MEQKTCRACKSVLREIVMDLGSQVLASTFIRKPIEEKVPLAVARCNNPLCGLVQLTNTVNADEMYKSMKYGYRSGLNAMMIKHLEGIVKYVLSFCPDPNLVVDIGSNDATLLSSYPNPGLKRVGIDPTGEQFREFYKGNIDLIPDYFTEENFRNVFGERKADCITSISMFYDLPDPQQFVRDIASILDVKRGVWVMEQSYLYTMLENNSFDTVCHEHLEYYSLKVIENLCKNAGLRIVHVELNDCNGGSFRVAIAHEGSDATREHEDHIETMRAYEDALEQDVDLWPNFERRCDTQKRRLMNLINVLKKNGKDVCLYGASTKGNTLLQHYGIDGTVVRSALERNPAKFGCITPGTNIPIESEQTAKRPDFAVVLPWHFKSNFLEKNDMPPLIFPLPKTELVAFKKTALITGVTGQIGQHLAAFLLAKGYMVFGTSRSAVASVPGVIMFHVEKNERRVWEDIMCSIVPEEMYHLAGMTSSMDSVDTPLETMEDNSTFPMMLLDIIDREKLTRTKFFCANSIEIYKGLKNVKKIDLNSPLSPTTPYGISKVAALMTCRYYRSLGVRAYSGILTNTESTLRSSRYVTKKIVEFFKSDDAKMTLGNIDTRRDWTHANDVARAMHMLVNQDQVFECIIATGKTHTIRDFIDAAIDINMLKGNWCGDTWNGVDKIIESHDITRWYEPSVAPDLDIEQLKQIGWVPEYDLYKLVESMI